MSNKEEYNLLELIPVKNCEFEIFNDTVVLFQLPKVSRLEKIIFRKLSKIPMKIDLDEIGSFIWNLADGKKNNAEILEQLKLQFENLTSADERFSLFIKQMNQQGFIKLLKKNIQ